MFNSYIDVTLAFDDDQATSAHRVITLATSYIFSKKYEIDPI